MSWSFARRSPGQHSRFRAAAGMALLSLVLGGVATGSASAAGSKPDGVAEHLTGAAEQPKPTGTAKESAKAADVPSKDRTRLLGRSWKSSTDRAWTTTGDADGFHVLVATENTGYAWHNAATLVEPGFDTDAWIGNACVTASGRRAVVVYAPRTFTNEATLFARGGFTAVVDLKTGAVRKLGLQASLAYYNPGCGVGESAVLTRAGGEDKAATQLVRLDARSGKLTKPLQVVGQVTSAVPLADGAIAAADSSRLIRIDAKGVRKVLASARSVPFNLRTDRDGGVVFLDHTRDTTAVHQVPRARSAKASTTLRPTLARGALLDVGLTSAANGKVFITGKATTTAELPASIQRLDVDQEARMSTLGRSAVVHTLWSDGQDSRVTTSDAGSRSVDIDVRALATGKSMAFRLDPTFGTSAAYGQGGVRSPALRTAGTATTSTRIKAAADDPSPTNPIEAERYCSVPRNDPRNQVLQPKPRQVEWAVDQAITNNLNSLISRPADWKNLGMPAYQPQTLIPRLTPIGGDHVPAQVMLGITAQESNMWQASRHAVPGVTGNPLIGNFYGVDIYNDVKFDDWDINWSDADCGYGITQITDHMRLAGHEKNAADVAFPYQTQRAVALDYTVNIAAGLQILTSKWNQTQVAGMTLNNNDVTKPENWFYALWAYNSGYHPAAEANNNDGAYGLGWLNNPVNPEYPANRDPFMEYGAADAAHPQFWPYQEKVLGFAAHPPAFLESPGTTVAAFRAAWWNGDTTTGPANRRSVKPPVTQFCDASNQCEPGQSYTPNAPEVAGSKAGPCAHKNAAGQYDLKCWYHQASTWKTNCSYTCGNELIRFNNTYAEQADGTAYPPNCSLSGLPANALVIDDQPDTVASIRPGCGRTWSNAGTFGFNFAGGPGYYSSKIDLHQIGAGFGGHFYFDHTRTATAEQGALKVTGTWTLNTAQTGKWERILVHLPDIGAHTQQAGYKIDTGSGDFTETRYISQKRKANNWVSLGVYKMTGTPRVRLATETEDGTGDDDIAWDAVAFQPLPAKPKHIVAVLGDSYTSGEGVGNWYPETDTDHGTDQWNACRRSKDAWGRRITLPGTSGTLGAKADAWDTDVDLGFVACSGAQTQNIETGAWADGMQPHGEGQFHEVHQVDSGVLTANTTLVMLTLGGNDSNGFTSAMTACANITDCSADEGFLPDYEGRVDRMIGDLSTSIQQIAARAPKAQIVLMGYPELLSRSVKCSGSLYFDGPEVAALATLVNYADSKQQDLVGVLRSVWDIKVDYANPVADFVGHAGCDNDEWINKFVVGPDGDGDFHPGDAAVQPFGCTPEWAGNIGVEACLSRSSFHPKKAGTGDPGYAGVMRQRLVEIGYAGT